MEQIGRVCAAGKAAGHPTAVEDDGTVADASDFFGVRGNQEYGKALLGPLSQCQIKLVASTNVHASGRFFEDEYCQIFDQPAGQAGLLLIAARQQAQRLVEVGGANPQAVDPALCVACFAGFGHGKQAHETVDKG